MVLQYPVNEMRDNFPQPRNLQGSLVSRKFHKINKLFMLTCDFEKQKVLYHANMHELMNFYFILQIYSFPISERSFYELSITSQHLYFLKTMQK